MSCYCEKDKFSTSGLTSGLTTINRARLPKLRKDACVNVETTGQRSEMVLANVI